MYIHLSPILLVFDSKFLSCVMQLMLDSSSILRQNAQRPVTTSSLFKIYVTVDSAFDTLDLILYFLAMMAEYNTIINNSLISMHLH
jgi:hypothetical protein